MLVTATAFLARPAGKFAAIGLAVVLAVVAFLWWLDNERDEAVEADRAQAAAQVAKTTERAEQAAQATTQAVQSEVQKGNDDARQAAATDSTDPLAAAVARLRERQARDRTAASRTD